MAYNHAVMQSSLVLIVAPSELDRYRLVHSAAQRWSQSKKWPIRHLHTLPEPSLFNPPEVWIVESVEMWPDPKIFLEECQGVLIGAGTKVAAASPWRRGEVVDLTGEKPWDRESRVARTLVEMAAHRGKKLAQDLAVLLVRRLGVDHPSLDTELDKILLFSGERHQLQEADVLAVTQASHHETGWQLGDAVLTQDLGAAMHLADQLLVGADQQLSSLLAQIRYQIEQALAVLQMQPADLQKHYPYLKGRRLEHLLQVAKRRGAPSLEKALAALAGAEAEARQHGGHQEHYWLLQRVLRKVMT
jgi:hypothetical protein